MYMNASPLVRLGALVLALLVVALGVLSYFYYESYKARTEAARQYANEKASLEAGITELEQELRVSSQNNDALARELQAEKAKTGEFEETLEDLRGSVSTLEKLQYTDPELLNKYSKVYFLNENYVPTDTARIPSEYSVPEGRTHEMHARVLPYLVDLLEEAEEDGIDLRIASAYRSFGTQAALKTNYTVTYGSGANTFSADQGYSEHQLGTTVDFSTETLGTNFTSIESTEAFEWLSDNAHKYGFVLSYPKGNTYYQYEPWHWRFVGEKLARDLHRQDKNLYDLDQRTIDEYLVYLFD